MLEIICATHIIQDSVLFAHLSFGSQSQNLILLPLFSGCVASHNVSIPVSPLSLASFFPPELRHLYSTQHRPPLSSSLKESLQVEVFFISWGPCQDVKSYIPKKCPKVNKILVIQFYILIPFIKHPKNIQSQ